MFKQLLILITVFNVVRSVCIDPNEKELSGICFHYVKQKMTFEDAKHWCHYENPVISSNLAYVPTQFSANFLASYARNAFGETNGSFWIGLSRSHNWDQWTWDTGLFLDGWSNFDAQHNKNYAAEQISNGKWITLDDTEKHYFVCSYDPTNPPTFPPFVQSTPLQTIKTTTTTRGQPTTTVNFPPCSKPFHGKIALAYEMTKLPQTKGILDFIQKYLYNSTNYKFEDGTTQAVNVPYPDSGVYENYILHYPDATSAEILDINIDQLYGEVMDLTDPKIERAYEYILEERNPGNTTTNVLITVGVSDYAVFDGSATSYLHQLQNKYGFRSIAVSIGTTGSYLGDLAESRDWYFAVTDSNSQWVADQISRIICHL